MSCLTRGPWARPLSGAATLCIKQAWAKPNFSSPKDALCTAWKWLSVCKLSKILHVEKKDRWPCFKGVCLSYISILLYLQRIIVIVFFFWFVLQSEMCLKSALEFPDMCFLSLQKAEDFLENGSCNFDMLFLINIVFSGYETSAVDRMFWQKQYVFQQN